MFQNFNFFYWWDQISELFSNYKYDITIYYIQLIIIIYKKIAVYNFGYF